MSDETSTPRISTAPAVMDSGSDGEISALRKEVIEARNLVIKTDNLLKNLHAELKQMGRKHEEQEKRHWMTSVIVYVAMAILVGAGAIAYARGGWGSATNYSSQGAADNAAVNNCNQQTSGCSVVAEFSNSCGAIATAPTGQAGWSSAQSGDGAQALALGYCATR